jgi:hypothetical protein
MGIVPPREYRVHELTGLLVVHEIRAQRSQQTRMRANRDLRTISHDPAAIIAATRILATLDG